MSRRPPPPGTMLTLDFGTRAGAISAAVETAGAPALEDRARPVADTDQRLVNMWVHGKSPHTQRAYKRAAEQFLHFVGKPLRAVTLGDV